MTTPSIKKPKSDRTCCLHAEWRAILDALATSKKTQLEGATLYFARVDDEGRALASGLPYCTVCSRLALDVGIGTWVLANAQGIVRYAAAEYDWLSSSYDELVP